MNEMKKNRCFWPSFLTLKRMVWLSITLIITIVALVYFLGGYQAVKPTYQADPFTKEGFVAFKDLPNIDIPYVLENDNFRFEFNKRYTTFKLIEKDTGKEWLSNPELKKDNKGDYILPTSKIEQNQQSVLNLFYVAGKGSTKLYNNYTYSISDRSGGESVEPSYEIKLDDENNVIQVLYTLGERGIDYTYFPFRLSVDRMEELVANHKRLVEEGKALEFPLKYPYNDSPYEFLLKSIFFSRTEEKQKDGTVIEYYERDGSNKPEDIGAITARNIYTLLYDNNNYTREDAERDNAEFGYVIEAKQARFEIAIEYKLTNNGLNTKILTNSINETPDFPLAYVEILPYFTSADKTVDGYMVIPDGSGAIMNYNNGKTTYPQYSKRIYSPDLALKQPAKKSDVEDVLLPMFGIVNFDENQVPDSGMIVDIVQGASQMRLSADISGRTEDYNKIYFTANYRESQQVTIGTGWYASQHVKWTNSRVMNDFVVSYYPLDKEDLSYSAMAKKYRDILIKRYGLVLKDITTKTVVNVDLIGAYDFRNDFLGIGYTDHLTMTTFKQTEEIVDDLLEIGANDLNLFFQGWRKAGLINESFLDMSYHKLLGRKKDLDNLIAYLNQLEIDLYQVINFGEINSFQETFGRNHYTVHDVANDFVKKYPYDPASYLYDQTKKPIYPVSPKYYGQFMQNIINDFDQSLRFPNLAFNVFGNKITGDYQKNNEFFRSSAVQETIKALEMAKTKINKMTFNAPADFVFSYTDIALNVPYEATLYEILDYSIPFYQLVVSGLFDYSGIAINANDDLGTMWHLMHILETGSNVHFIFSYEDSSKLIQTDYNYYYYTQYSKWLNDVETVMNTINQIAIHDKELVSHEIIDINVYKVIYQNETEQVTIYLNYSDAPIVVNSEVINSKSYLIQKGVL